MPKQNTNATVIKEEENKVIRLSGPIEGVEGDVNQWSEVVDENDKPIAVKIELAKGEVCDGSRWLQTTITMHCDDSVADGDFYKTLKYTSSDDCTYIIEARSLYGCTLRSSYLLLRLLNDFKFVFEVIFVLVGIVFCFFGLRFKEKTIVICCGFIGCYAISTAFLAWFPSFITDELGLIICLLVCFVLGCVISYLLRNEDSYYCLIGGGLLGYYVSSYVFAIVSNYIEWNPQYLEYACIGVCIVVGAIIGYKLDKVIIILGTSLLGGYLAMRGVSLIVGNYLDEGYIIDLIKNQEYDQLKELRDGWVFGYLGAWTLLFIIGLVIQCKHYKKDNSGKV